MMPSLVVDGKILMFSDEAARGEYKEHLEDAEYW